MTSGHDPQSQRHRAHGLARALGDDTIRNPNPALHIVFDQPVIPPNTGNAIRMCAGVGAHLHLCEPLGFTLEEKNLRRAGLDYHDLADVTLHPSLDQCLASLGAAPADRRAEITSSAGSGGSSVDRHAHGHTGETVGGDLEGPRVYAFTSNTSVRVDRVRYRWGDILLFGCEPTGLSDDALSDPRITSRVRIPMRPGRRSMNLSNAAAVAAYEAWRQFDYAGGE